MAIFVECCVCRSSTTSEDEAMMRFEVSCVNLQQKTCTVQTNHRKGASVPKGGVNKQNWMDSVWLPTRRMFNKVITTMVIRPPDDPT